MLMALGSGQDEVVFHSTVDLIRVDVQVLHGDKPVSGLKAEDFVVLDEGEPQPIVEFGSEQQDLDLFLLLDVSSSMTSKLRALKQQASEAISKLHFRDRVGVLIFDYQPYLVIEPTWDWYAVDEAIRELNFAGKGTELNHSLYMSARFLASRARPGARRGLVVFSDNMGRRAIPDASVRDGLWESDVVVSAVIFPQAYRKHPTYVADLRPFVAATGGDFVYSYDDHFDLGSVLLRMRQRYSLLYRAPKRKPGSICRIQVKMRNPDKAAYQIQARSGYKAGVPNSDGQPPLTLHPN